MTFEESQTEFAAWCVVSSPLTLSFDMSNLALYDLLWPIISNQRAIAINQAWAGSAGRLAAASSSTWTGVVFHGAACEVNETKTLPEWTVWTKPLPQGFVAAVVINTLNSTTVTPNITLEQLGFPAGTADLDATQVCAPPTPCGCWQRRRGLIVLVPSCC
jgi:hypothetical protein